jgi:hypothetical protein
MTWLWTDQEQLLEWKPIKTTIYFTCIPMSTRRVYFKNMAWIFFSSISTSNLTYRCNKYLSVFDSRENAMLVLKMTDFIQGNVCGWKKYPLIGIEIPNILSTFIATLNIFIYCKSLLTIVSFLVNMKIYHYVVADVTYSLLQASKDWTAVNILV